MKVVDENNNISTFKKSTLCWLLSEKVRLSNDRLQRYVHDKQRKEKNLCEKISNYPLIRKESFIKNGDFIVCKYGAYYLLMEVLNFQHMFQKTLKAKRYSKTICPLNTKSEIGVMGNTHLISDSFKLLWNPDSQYIHIKNYVCHVDKSLFKLDEKTISPTVLEYLKK